MTTMDDTELKAVITDAGPARVLRLMRDMGAVYPLWGTDANESPFIGWVERNPPERDDTERG